MATIINENEAREKVRNKNIQFRFYLSEYLK